METPGSNNSLNNNVYPQTSVSADAKLGSNRYKILIYIVLLLLLILGIGTLAFLFAGGSYKGWLNFAIDKRYISPLKTNSSYLELYGFAYTVETSIKSVTFTNDEKFEINTAIEDPDFPKKLNLTPQTRVLALDGGQERPVPKKSLKEGMNVTIAIFYNLQNKKWLVNKIVIKDIPYNQLMVSNQAIGSAQER